MNFIPTPRWIVDEWFSNPKIHGILQNVIQVFTLHPWPSFAKGPKHHGRKMHGITS
jgi:hypothetical protein